MVTASREAVELGIRFRIPVRSLGGPRSLKQCPSCRHRMLPDGLEDRLRTAFRRRVQRYDPVTVGSYADLTSDGRAIDVSLWFGGMLTPLEREDAAESFTGLQVLRDGEVMVESPILLENTPFGRDVLAVLAKYRKE